jgi:hypothetical protein
MRGISPLLTRCVIVLMCVMHVGLGMAAGINHHRGSAAEGYLCGSHRSADAIASLAGVVPEVFAETYRQLTGSGEDCCGACPACGPAAIPASNGAIGMETARPPVLALHPAGDPRRIGIHKPPSTAPPVHS